MPPSLFAYIVRLAGETEAARLNRCLASHRVDHYMVATCEVNYEQLQSPPVWGGLHLMIIVKLLVELRIKLFYLNKEFYNI